MSLWPHQIRALDAIRASVASGHRRILLSLPTGMGKTACAKELVDEYLYDQKLVSLYSNRKLLVDQTSGVMARAGIEHGVRMSGARADLDRFFQISSVQTESARVLKKKRWTLHPADLVIIDECFPAGTIVDGRPIELIRPGELVMSFDHGSGSATRRNVVATSKTSCDVICKISFESGKELCCTVGHPVWSEGRGRYVPAAELAEGEGVIRAQAKSKQPASHGREGAGMQRVQDRIPYGLLRQNEAVLLLGRVQGQDDSQMSLRQSCNKEEAFRPHEGQKPDASGIGSGADGSDAEADRSPAEGSRWKRSGTDSARRGSSLGARVEVFSGRSVRATANEGRLRHPLQDRRGLRGVEGGNRDRRSFARLPISSRSGCQETVALGIERVARVEVYERGSGPGFESLCPGGVVFNLEVQGHHNYFADGVLVHNCHVNGGPTCQKIAAAHLETNPDCVILGLTATPLDLAHFYDHLIVAGTTSEGRLCGALVPAATFGPDEPDLRHVGRVEVGDDLTENQNRKAMGGVTEGKPDRKLVSLFGRVFEWWERLNPEQRPTILFAPGVAESLWFADQFRERGICAAHIDGEEVWIDGTFYHSSPEARERVRQGSMNGWIKVVCNRFVLREGVDWPWLEHGIFATVFGSLQTYLQAGGRLLRASPGKTRAVIQDHGSSWWRHGSLNADREWELSSTARIVTALRHERLRAKEESEPARCPKCAQIMSSRRCVCGYVIDFGNKFRPVVQVDGSLKEMRGDIFVPRVTKLAPDTVEKWTRMYYRMRKAGKTFAQARGLFWAENSYFPDEGIPLMPRNHPTWFQKIEAVPRGELQ